MNIEQSTRCAYTALFTSCIGSNFPEQKGLAERNFENLILVATCETRSIPGFNRKGIKIPGTFIRFGYQYEELTYDARCCIHTGSGNQDCI